MRDSSNGEQYKSQDRYRVIIYNTIMARLFHFGASLMNSERLTFPLLMVIVFVIALVNGAVAATENYSATLNSADGHSGKDNGGAGSNALAGYLKGYGVEMNSFGQYQQQQQQHQQNQQHQQQQQESIEYQNDYDTTQARYGNSDGNSDEQQSHISAGYYHPQSTYHLHHLQASASGNSYDVPHQSDIDKFVESNFPHQYEQESAGIGNGFHSSAQSADGGGIGGSFPDYHQSHDGFSPAQHHHQHTDVINYVPYPVVKKLHIPYSKPVQIPISHAVIVPERKPVPIHIPIMKQVQVPVEKELKIPIERLVPYPVEKQVPVPVEKHVPYTVVRYVPVKVPKPYPVKVPVTKTIVHKVKQFW